MKALIFAAGMGNRLRPLTDTVPKALLPVDGRPMLLTLRDLIRHFVEHRHDVVVRRTRFDLRKAEERLHIVLGLLIAQDNIDEVVRIIRAAKSVDEAKATLSERFGLRTYITSYFSLVFANLCTSFWTYGLLLQARI